ncbi:transposase (plasmid) [Mycetohabitans rhizoxinica]|uniref:Transposase n=1 Tax=Mycetohabitans rhizoxinica TaxID=412963 RepID=A0ABZ2Q011_9BURK
MASPLTIIVVDNWPFERGHRYGTLLVDLERRRPSDLLPERNTTTVASWLSGHRAAQLGLRDRAAVYVMTQHNTA